METFTQVITDEQFALLPTEEDVQFYEKHGWYISKKVIPHEMIDEAILACERFYQGERDGVLPISSGYCNWKPEDGDVTRNNEFISLQSNALRKFALQPIIGAIAARLARTKQIRILDDQIISKPPKSGKTTIGWHVDRAYWSTCTSDNLLTAWIPFQDCDELMGPIAVFDRSHKWSGLENMRSFNNPNLEEIEQNLCPKGEQIIKLPMTLKKGQMSFHHCWTIHGSYPNTSDRTRLAMAIHLQDEANQYRHFWNQKGEEVHILNELLCRKLPKGDPDFHDPAVFPVLWSE
ncbi:MAG: phytanoyl-CoA dioxygenase [Oscillatoriales cyanobacterium]|uniref:Phytanoyl-CoA dioxygenase family protein n=1 Tax=Microcoleus anatoxicus PTRS2 TaxID=2705321 RepID=A0ABU8YG17_9CYAN|nr:MAG: phytanoyl-CoA dioxygenase [Oscillatoriales cyanobacterium]TAD95829.1 MAG: phytanoyl-CoA dioxygenase [Oscillatoriales cyanobacterium]TAE03466.1 MAG: phytanoyl-CoA dioxygenase [Oscillatoriales cyanobacterium]TAF04071.1 MAG: phytanoyl-CoA dioxygenase [Oscillatoriales cyanobacterium]TAF48013.1 MAG: phytanoyl-CoA dioxygenase [Oscillatoriales cyanobacterium]